MENYDRPAYSQVRPDGLVVLVWGIFDHWRLHVYRPAFGRDNGLILHNRASHTATRDEMIQLGRDLAA